MRCYSVVYPRVTPNITVAGFHLQFLAVRGSTVRVKKCLAQEHSAMTQAMAQTQTAQSRVKQTNHEDTTPSCLWCGKLITSPSEVYLSTSICNLTCRISSKISPRNFPLDKIHCKHWAIEQDFTCTLIVKYYCFTCVAIPAWSHPGFHNAVFPICRFLKYTE